MAPGDHMILSQAPDVRTGTAEYICSASCQSCLHLVFLCYASIAPSCSESYVLPMYTVGTSLLKQGSWRLPESQERLWAFEQG